MTLTRENRVRARQLAADIMKMCLWDDTPQGWEYWEGVRRNLIAVGKEDAETLLAEVKAQRDELLAAVKAVEATWGFSEGKSPLWDRLRAAIAACENRVISGR